MWTFAYRDGWIHGWFDRDEVRAQFPSGVTRVVRSVHAAKCLLTRARW